MTVEEPAAPRGATGTGADPAADQPLSTLRGAGVDVDLHRAGQLVVGVCLVALGVTAVVLLVAGFQKNAQIDHLRTGGVPVGVTVDNCVGLMGGSGSNVAGYACTGSYTVGGRRFTEAIPGDGALKKGSVVEGVTTAADPALLSTPGIVASERASARVFVLPVVLLVLLAALIVSLLVRRRHRRTRQGS